MSFSLWLLVLGTLLLILALASAYLRLLPVSSSVLYLAFGLVVGPFGLELWQLGLGHISLWLEHLAEVAVLVSLFIGGLKLRLPLRAMEWRAAWLLAGPVLVGTILGMTLVGHLWLGLDWGLALLVAAILSPTDPVLASLVQVSRAGDVDRLRYAISGEAGFNDGIAFPFVVLALLLIADQSALPPTGDLLRWLLVDVLWAIPAGLLLGYWLGRGTGRLVIYLRARHTDTVVTANDFLALALIALSYACAEFIGAWGFLATFAAGLGLRHAEVETSSHTDEPAEESGNPEPREEGQANVLVEFGSDPEEHPQIAAGALMADILSFGGLLERILEILLVTLLGALLFYHWDWRALPLALALFCLVRPAMVVLLIRNRQLPLGHRLFVGWFGIRGIGSLYYLSYALNHDLSPLAASEASDLVLSVVALSILFHGLSTQPLLNLYERFERR
ncbi:MULTISPECIES: sodium:proton antiporter [unclassified Pseudomonas]|uniref:cation:proton antiporter n=1 Tax=unclassified Pseudomonas TaxID=196821 RepID=UPI00244BDC97|nr:MULTISPECIES: sodium:proton antiporter [unclassified Pseudomonas]MDG9924226.1 sodium:proton antiporter [Pseudomonas sp. GD04045]MDH0036656.1 sodium:proton antiporter [Pseudomonas sp. GD04019]